MGKNRGKITNCRPVCFILHSAIQFILFNTLVGFVSCRLILSVMFAYGFYDVLEILIIVSKITN